MAHSQIFTTTTYNLKGEVKSVESKAYEAEERNGKIVEGSENYFFPIGKFIHASLTSHGDLVYRQYPYPENNDHNSTNTENYKYT